MLLDLWPLWPCRVSGLRGRFGGGFPVEGAFATERSNSAMFECFEAQIWGGVVLSAWGCWPPEGSRI